MPPGATGCSQTIRLRNRVRWVNDFYDDMAWLALASGRLRGPARRSSGARPGGDASARPGRHLTAQLRSAHTDDLGGGLFWSRDRDFKNSPRHRAGRPAPGPSRRHRRGTPARRLAVCAALVDRRAGSCSTAYGCAAARRSLVPDVWSYNQGTVLGALVDARRPREPRPRGRARRRGRRPADRRGRTARGCCGRTAAATAGSSPGSSCVYLALAATSGSGLAEQARATARRLVLDTAESLWRGPREPDRRRAAGPLGLPARARRDRPAAAARAVAAAAGLDRPRGRRHARLSRPTTVGMPFRPFPACRAACRWVASTNGRRSARAHLGSATRLGAGWESAARLG